MASSEAAAQSRRRRFTASAACGGRVPLCGAPAGFERRRGEAGRIPRRRSRVCSRCLRGHASRESVIDTTPLFALVYQELRRIARRQRHSAGSPPTLDTTVLVHETYLKLQGTAAEQGLSRAHFISLAARAMRQVLVDHARTRGRIKRGGLAVITDLHDGLPSAAASPVDVLALDEALAQLAERDPRAAQLVEWHVFGGLEIDEIARMQNLTARTVFRDWRRARAFLGAQLGIGSAGAERE